MSKVIVSIIASVALVSLAGCNDSYEEPTKAKIKEAMSELSSGRAIDLISNLACDDLGKGKFFCRFDISYLGSGTETLEKCIYSAASEFTIQSSDRCYN